jgi:hypothetical protein
MDLVCRPNFLLNPSVMLPTAFYLRCGRVPLRDFEHRSFDGVENLEIAGAAAQVSRECFTNLIAARTRILVQERLCCQEDGGRAIATLRSAEVGEGIL